MAYYLTGEVVEEKETPLEENPAWGDPATDSIFATLNIPPKEHLFGEGDLIAVTSSESEEAVQPWLSGALLDRVFGHRHTVSRALGMPREDLRTRVPDMGGGFGAKFRVYPEQILVAALARKLGRPVRWQETRRDNLACMYQGRDQYQEIEIGAMKDGRMVGLKATVLQDTGAYPAFGTWLPTLTLKMACGVYDIPAVELEFYSVATNTTPTDAYRGAGRPEATAMLERAVDMLAVELDLDPVDIRHRNFIAPDAFPFETPAKALYDSGEYAVALDRAVEIADYAALRHEQERRRSRGARHQLGIGVSTYVEITAARGDDEWSSVEVHDDGSATVKVGTSSLPFLKA